MIYTFGHGRKNVGRLIEMIKNIGIDDYIILDIRLKPYTRAPGWSKHELQRTFRGRYKWVPEWGNVLYKTDRILIKDWEGGLEKMRKELNNGKVPILLCSCSNYETCHRKYIAEKLREIGFETKELTDRKSDFIQLKLIE